MIPGSGFSVSSESLALTMAILARLDLLEGEDTVVKYAECRPELSS